MFDTFNSFIEYIFSFKYEGSESEILPTITGKYGFADISKYLDTIPLQQKIYLLTDIHFFVEKLVIEQFTAIYPQELFGYMLEEEVNESNLNRVLESYYLASWVTDYIKESIKKEKAPEPPNVGLNLPIEMDSTKARECFGRCIKQNWLEPTKDGAIWKEDLIRLAYICSKIYNNPRPIKALEKYFGVHKLDASITQAVIPAKRADAILWRNEIDKLIF